MEGNNKTYYSHVLWRAMIRPWSLEHPGGWEKHKNTIPGIMLKTKNREKTGIILGSVKHRSAPNDKTRNTGFHVADVLSKQIG